MILRQFRAMGIPLVNDLDGVTIARHQYVTLQILAAAGIPVPDTCFVTRQAPFLRPWTGWGDIRWWSNSPVEWGGTGCLKSMISIRPDPV